MHFFTSIKTIIFLVLVFTLTRASAQVTIQSTSFAAQLQLGEQVITYNDRSTKQINVGSQGASSWDFSALKIDDQFVTESKTVATSPYAAQFPNAQFASNYEGIFEGNYSNTWVYSSLGATYLTHGTGTVAQTSAGNVKTVIQYNPAWVQYTFPIRYNDTHSYTGTQTVTTYVTIPGLGEFPTSINQGVTIDQVVDGYGVLTMPGGKRLNALRLLVTTTFNNNGTITTSKSIRFLTNTGESLSVTPAAGQEVYGLISIDNVSWNDGSGETLPEVTVNAPTGLNATAGEASITLNWTDASDNETAFVVERAVADADFILLATLEANATSYTDTEITAGITYSYRIKALSNEVESDYSTTVQAMVEIPVVTVNAPTGLSATAGEASITLNWTDASDNETAFVVERAVADADFTVLATLEANATSYTDTEITAGVTYSYRIKALSNEVESGYSSTVQAMVEIPVVTVNAPTGLNATAGEASITLNWTDASDNETAFVLERAEADGDFAILATLEANANSYIDAPITAGVTYSYRIKALSNEVESGYSSTVQAMVEIPVVTVNAPTGLSATAGETSITLNWTDASDNETAFVLERAVADADFTILATLEANANSYIDAPITAGVTYSYRIKALSNEVESGYSNTVQALVEIPVVTVNAPTGLSATAGETSITLNWTDASDNETAFVLERAVADADFTVLATLEANATSYTDSEITAGVTYSYRIKALNNEVESGYSSIVQAGIQTTGIEIFLSDQMEISNYPNPFSEKTTIQFALSADEFVTIRVLSMEGKTLKVVEAGQLEKGRHKIVLDGADFNAGIYFYTVQSASSNLMGRMMVVK